jgi:ferredoxin-2, mitochondrial
LCSDIDWVLGLQLNMLPCCCVQDQDYYDKIPEPTEDELDMLDLAFGLTEQYVISSSLSGGGMLTAGVCACRSRLGCQVIAAKELDGLKVKLPSATRNFYVDGHKPKPH